MALGQFFDPLGETENQDTIYTLTVYKPPRPPPKYLPANFTRVPVTYHNTGTYTIKPDNYCTRTPIYDDFEDLDLKNMPTKIMKLKAWQFPVGMRCAHVQPEKKCERGCYVLEKGGDVRRWSCGRENCEGHVYGGSVKMDDEGTACFGKKGERLVCTFWLWRKVELVSVE